MIVLDTRASSWSSHGEHAQEEGSVPAVVDVLSSGVLVASGEGVLCDGLPRQAAGPRFRFDEPNPTVTGRTYAQSLFAELPYMVSVLVRMELHLTEAAWDSLVTAGVSPPERPGRPPDGVCPDCWGTGYEIDDDATMTGVLGRLYVCCCTGAWI